MRATLGFLGDGEYDAQPELLPDDSDGLHQVRIVGNDEGSLAVLPETLTNFGPLAAGVARGIVVSFVRKSAERDFEVRDGSERPQIDLLADRATCKACP